MGPDHGFDQNHLRHVGVASAQVSNSHAPGILWIPVASETRFRPQPGKVPQTAGVSLHGQPPMNKR